MAELPKMKVDFNNIEEHTIPISQFKLKWRFMEKDYNVIPDIHLNQLKPLDNEAAKFLAAFISKVDLHAEVPFKKDFFSSVDAINILEDNNAYVKKWLYRRRLPFQKQVFLSWDTETAMIVPWKMLIRYFDSFYYGASDDLTVFDESLQWSLLFFHEDRIYFGTKTDFIPSGEHITL